MKKLFLSIIALLTLSVGMWAQTQSVTYIDENGVAQTADNVNVITNSTTTLNAGWYVVTGTDVQTGSLTCNGEVHLILADGAKLTTTGGNKCAGIQVTGLGNSLAIYGQTAQSGQLIATGGVGSAGIGGGWEGIGSNITINGGDVTANGGNYGAGIGGGNNAEGSNITINGGTVTANGGDNAAGIGGGKNGSASYITITGGDVTANGGIAAAGIGGGNNAAGSNITINGGTVTANGGNAAAGIGGGKSGEGYNIIINGGDVTANGELYGAGIGGGWKGIGSNITINGGTVTAIGGYDAPAIGNGSDATSPASNIKIPITCLIKADNNNPPTTVIENDGSEDLAAKLADKQYATIENLLSQVSYIDENGDEQVVEALKIYDASESVIWGKTGETTWYVVLGTDVQLAQGAVCAGNVHLILADGAKLTATGGDDYQAGIEVSGEDNSLSIYGQAAQSGRLIATGGESAAGIGGGDSGYGSNITINGGTVVATGGNSAAGIGGGPYGSGSNITINGGTVWARGGNYGGAGIGGGNFGSGSNIIINGGRVTATGGISGAGIGGGFDSSGSDIFMPDNYRIKADGTFIHNDGTDLADSLAGKQNVEAYPDGFLNERNAAFAAISAAVEDISNEAILAVAAAAMEAVFQAEGSGDIEASKQKALDDLQYVISIYNSGKAATLGTMGNECTDCPAVKISDDNTTIKLYNPKKVEFMKME